MAGANPKDAVELLDLDRDLELGISPARAPVPQTSQKVNVDLNFPHDDSVLRANLPPREISMNPKKFCTPEL
jgi:hypothetical protein